jgi:hypothetical protein
MVKTKKEIIMTSKKTYFLALLFTVLVSCQSNNMAGKWTVDSKWKKDKWEEYKDGQTFVLMKNGTAKSFVKDSLESIMSWELKNKYLEFKDLNDGKKYKYLLEKDDENTYIMTLTEKPLVRFRITKLLD